MRLKVFEWNISTASFFEIINVMFENQKEISDYYQFLLKKGISYWYSVSDFESNYKEFKDSLIEMNEQLIKWEISDNDQEIFIEVFRTRVNDMKKYLYNLEKKIYIEEWEKYDKESNKEDITKELNFI